jgi:hypothetical protein
MASKIDWVKKSTVADGWGLDFGAAAFVAVEICESSAPVPAATPPDNIIDLPDVK